MSQHGQTQPRKQPGVLGAGCCWGVCQASLSAGGWGWRGWGGVGDLAFPPCLCFIPSPPSLSRFQQVIPKFFRATEKIKRALHKAHTQQKALEGALRKRPAGRRVCNHTTCDGRELGKGLLCVPGPGDPLFQGPGRPQQQHREPRRQSLVSGLLPPAWERVPGMPLLCSGRGTPWGGGCHFRTGLRRAPPGSPVAAPPYPGL